METVINTEIDPEIETNIVRGANNNSTAELDGALGYDRSNNVELHVSRLKSMFPFLDPEYIREICVESSNYENEDEHLFMLIKQLDEKQKQLTQIMEDHEFSQSLQIQNLQEIEAKKNYERLQEQLFAEFLSKDQETLNDKIEFLINILPDASPDYLKKFVEENKEDNTSLEQFIESNLLHRNYEKRDMYFARMKVKEKIEQLTTFFNVENFVQQIPEPFQYFENPQRQCAKNDRALKFLQNRYSIVNEKNIADVYHLNKNNLSLTDKYFSEEPTNIPFYQTEFQFDDVTLLQEIAFIQNKNLIQSHLEEVEKNKKKEINLLRLQNLLMECECCYENEVKPFEVYECENYHKFCKSCIIKGTELAIKNGQTLVHCFQQCNKEIPLYILKKVILPETFNLLLKNRQEYEIMVAQLDGLVACPFCPYLMVLDPQINIFACKNPECMKITCRLCKKINHLPIKCKDVIDEHQGRLFIEEEMSKALIRYCLTCQLPFIKDYGCNTMTCPKCKTKMCYICRKLWSNAHNCRVTETVSFDEELVELRRVEATSKLLRQNPDLKIPKI